MINLKNISKEYIVSDVTTYALKDINLTINQGEIVVLLGQSGSGKSTLLNIISGLDQPTTGTVELNNEKLNEMSEKEKTKFRRQNIGFIFQQYNLLPTLTVEENIKLGEQLANDTYIYNDILSFVGLDKHTTKYPFQLSGGEQQRVSIARAIIKKPNILFCDEPTGALDEETSKDVLALIQKLNAEFNTTVVLITHNPHIAKLGDRVITLSNGRIKDIKEQTKINASQINWS